jgi:hypothetical protein
MSLRFCNFSCSSTNPSTNPTTNSNVNSPCNPTSNSGDTNETNIPSENSPNNSSINYEKVLQSIICKNHLIGKGSFGKVYVSPEFPEYVVKKMKKFTNFHCQFLGNNWKELWWSQLVSQHPNQHDVCNYPKLLFFTANDEHLFLLLKNKGFSVFQHIRDIIETESKQQQEQKHKKLLSLIPCILFLVVRVLYQLYHCRMRHGDITSSNIVIDYTQQFPHNVTIIDWGSVMFTKLKNASLNQCALDFSPPELSYKNQMDNIPSIKNDIFSLGLVILSTLDIHLQFRSDFKSYMKMSLENEIEAEKHLGNIMSKLYQNKIIAENVDKRVLVLLEQMLQFKIENRITIESLYHDCLFSSFRTNNNDRTVVRSFFNFPSNSLLDKHKNLLTQEIYQLLKQYKDTNYKNLYDSRLILVPVLQLFYRFIHFSPEKKCINHFVISLVASLKWIDILFNDELSVSVLYDFYRHLFDLLENEFDKSVLLDYTNFSVHIDILFLTIFTSFNGNILNYPYILDIESNKVSFRSLKKIVLQSDTI